MPLTEKEIETVKGQIKGTILLSSDQMETRQESLGRNELIYHRYISVDEVVSELEKVSPESVQALAQKVFVPEKQAHVILSRKPVGKLPELWG
jgi:predicted Zn-dependent peptidase